MSLFTKKAGGTLFGNLLRVAANKATGGIMGQGANMIPVGSQTPAQTVIQTASGVGAAVEAYKASQGHQTPVESAMQTGATNQFVKNNGLVIVLVLAVIGLFMYFKK